MKILLIEPYYTGSHKKWAKGLKKHSSHHIKILSMKGQFWKWRMHGGAVTLAKMFNNMDWKPDLILASYHGIPKKYFDKGDPYQCYCQKTSRLITEMFKEQIPIKTTFQSRFGPQEWLQPYTDKTFEKLPKEGIKNILVICPGFSSDCVETLEEILIQGKETFIEGGGKNFDLVVKLCRKASFQG